MVLKENQRRTTAQTITTMKGTPVDKKSSCITVYTEKEAWGNHGKNGSEMVVNDRGEEKGLQMVDINQEQ